MKKWIWICTLLLGCSSESNSSETFKRERPTFPGSLSTCHSQAVTYLQITEQELIQLLSPKVSSKLTLRGIKTDNAFLVFVGTAEEPQWPTGSPYYLTCVSPSSETRTASHNFILDPSEVFHKLFKEKWIQPGSVPICLVAKPEKYYWRTPSISIESATLEIIDGDSQKR